MATTFGDLSKVPTKQKIFMVLLLCGMILIGYYYMYYGKVNGQIRNLEGQLVGLQGQIRAQQAIAGNLPSFQEQVRKLEGELGILLEQLPNSAEIPSLLRSITDVGRESGLEFVKFAPKAESRKEFYAEIPVAIGVTGDYHSFALFADRVGRLPRIVNIANIDFITPKLTGDNVMSASISCTATTYRFLEKAPAADNGAKPPAKGKGK